MQFNNLDEEMPQEYAKETEIEGQLLFRFLIDESAGQIRLIHVPYRDYNYKIYTPKYNYFDYTRAEYLGNEEEDVNFDLTSPLFVYRQFGGSANRKNGTPPKTAFVLRDMEDLDKGLMDWRKINKLFSAPTPVIYAPDPPAAKKIEEWITQNNWRIGKALILGGLNVKFELVGWVGDGYTTLKEETQALVKTISGTTGVPVHFLGYPELLSNRDTADNLIELIALSTNKERRTWIGAYEDVLHKAMMLHNTAFGTTLNPMAINAIIPFVTATKIKEISQVFVPMYTAGAISLHTLLSQISGDVDVEAEMARVKAEQEEKEAKARELAKETANNAAISNRSGASDKSE
jgi:hypothetical protein